MSSFYLLCACIMLWKRQPGLFASSRPTLPTLIRCSVLLSADALMKPFLNGVSLKSPHRLVVYCCSLLYKLAQPLCIFCFTRSFSASSPGSSPLPAEQSLYHSQKTKTVALSPFVFVSIAVPMQFDLSSSAASVLRLQWFPIIAQYTFRDPCSIYTHTPL